jgi:hypothetical protein
MKTIHNDERIGEYVRRYKLNAIFDAGTLCLS